MNNSGKRHFINIDQLLLLILIVFSSLTMGSLQLRFMKEINLSLPDDVNPNRAAVWTSLSVRDQVN